MSDRTRSNTKLYKMPLLRGLNGALTRGERVQFVIEDADKIKEMRQLLVIENTSKTPNTRNVAKFEGIIKSCKYSVANHLEQIAVTQKDKNNIKEITSQIYQWIDDGKSEDIKFMLLQLLYNGNPGKYGQQLAIAQKQRG